MNKLPKWFKRLVGFTAGFTFVVVLVYYPLYTSACIVGGIIALLMSVGGSDE